MNNTIDVNNRETHTYVQDVSSDLELDHGDD
jgi:hypothetical protein